MIKSFSKLKKQNKEEFRIPKTTQDVIPIDTVYKDGIFKIGNRYTKKLSIFGYKLYDCIKGRKDRIIPRLWGFIEFV